MTAVIKLGGRVQSDRRLIEALAGKWRVQPGSFCIVHGGGDEISSLQRQLGREPSFVNGRRVTTDADVDLVRMVLSGSANKRLVAALVAAGISAVGISGEDAALIRAEPIDVKEFGRAGKPKDVQVDVLRVLLDAGFLPVISPIGTDVTSADGMALNVNGDDAAAAIAGALGAELWLIADVPGVMNRNSESFSSLDASQVERLVADGTVNSGMRAKLEAGFAALNAGATTVRVGGLEIINAERAGTVLSQTPSMT